MRYLTILALLPIIAFSQVDEIKFSKWFNGAKGAYTIMHDDFCMDHSSGIAEYADSIAGNYQINFDFPVVTNHCDADDWAKARELISHGHELSNHSHNHYCGLPVTWCPTKSYDSSDFKTEYNLSTDLIIKNTGEHPKFFIYPFDLHTGTMHSYLMKLGYVATRSGPQSGINHPNNMDLERIGFQVLRPDQGLEQLNELADLSIKMQQWGVRVCHGVNDASWGSISLDDYTAHMEFLKSKIENNQLWVTTLAPIQEYLEIKRKSAINLISVDNNKTTYSLSSPRKFHLLTIQLKSTKNIKKITCNGQKVNQREEDGLYFFNIPTGEEFIIFFN